MHRGALGSSLRTTVPKMWTIEEEQRGQTHGRGCDEKEMGTLRHAVFVNYPQLGNSPTPTVGSMREWYVFMPSLVNPER